MAMASSEAFFRLDRKVAVVTGGGQGIGEAICRRLAAAGAAIAVFDLDGAKAERLPNPLGGLALAGDVCSESAIARALTAIEQKLGPVDILVNNAGITGKAAPTWELAKADLESVLAVNLVGPFLWCRAVLPDMLTRRFGR